MTDPSGTGPAGELRAAAKPGSGEVTATVIVNASAERVFAGFTAWERQGSGSRSPGSGWSRGTVARAAWWRR
ncbi:hypothetical protein GCM10027605_07710 [Micromonospora zhanjiangensis]